MIDLKSGLASVTDKEQWAAHGASFVTKVKATKAVWFPPKLEEAGKKAASTAKKATKKATKSTTRKSTAAARKSTGATKRVTKRAPQKKA
jgi:hypothetical protein